MSILGLHPELYSMRYEGRFIAEQAGLLDLLKQVETATARFREQMTGPWYKQAYRTGTPREYSGGMHTEIDAAALTQLVDAFESELSHSLVEKARTFTDLLYARCIKGGQTRWLEKTPSNMLHMKKLLEIYPGAKFVHVIRDGRDVAQSITENQFWPISDWHLRAIQAKDFRPFKGQPKNIENAARFWCQYLTAGLAESKKLPAGSYFELRLEDLVANPRAQLGKVCDFLGLELADRLFRRSLSSDSIGKWRQAYSDEDKAVFKREAGDLLVQLGYADDSSW